MSFRNNPTVPKRIFIGDDSSLNGANLMRNLTTIIYVHGFTEQGNSKGASTIKKGTYKRKLSALQFNLNEKQFSTFKLIKTRKIP